MLKFVLLTSAAFLSSTATTDAFFFKFLCKRPIIRRFIASRCTTTPTAVTLSFVEFSETKFNRIGNPICIELENDSFLTTSNTIANFTLQGSLVEVSSFNASMICSNASLTEGKNEVSLEALNMDQDPLTFNGTLWAGSDAITVNVFDTSSNIYLGLVNVTATLGDDAIVTETLSTNTGSVIFDNLPMRTILFSGRTETLEVGSTAAVAGSSTETSLVLVGFGNTSSIANNDFSKGLAGWVVQSGGATTENHSETKGPPDPLVPDLEGTNVTSERRLVLGDLTTLEDKDLSLCTDGVYNGIRQISRVFKAPAGATMVHIRYRFVTEEVPGGYFGSKFNDFFSVSLRSLNRGSVATEAGTMNGLGLAAFDENGSTAWRSALLPLSVAAAEVVAVDITVGNVEDDLFDSCVYVDFVEEWKCSSADQEKAEVLKSITNYDAFIAGIKLKYGSFWVSSRTGLCGSSAGPQDAFRHCYWNCRMAQSFGTEKAELVGTVHEACNTLAAADDIKMDLSNNEMGRQLSANGGDCETLCLTALQQQKLAVLVPCTECKPGTEDVRGECDPFYF